jgi:hypothetical protein
MLVQKAGSLSRYKTRRSLAFTRAVVERQHKRNKPKFRPDTAGSVTAAAAAAENRTEEYVPDANHQHFRSEEAHLCK